MLVTLAVSVAMYADRVTKEQAQHQASAFMQQTHAARARRAPGKLVTDRVQLAVAEKDGNYFVFNSENETGFVIIAGSDLVSDVVLGYSESGSFDPTNLPENKRAWLEGYAQQIAYMEAHNIRYSAPRKAKSNISPMINTHWNQSAPYNNDCAGNVTGCVATAMAQVMKFWGYPSSVQNTIPTHGFAAVASGTSLDWTNMVNNYTGAETPAQKNAVSQLMKICGMAVKMNWGSSSSGADSRRVPAALHRYFGYSDDMYYDYAEEHSASEWDDLVYAELAAGRPVLYDGSTSTNDGHAFVLDGYQASTGKYHVNWGWGGLDDEYYVLTLMDPPTKGIGGGGGGGYSYAQGAAFNVKPGNGTICPPRLKTVFAKVLSSSATKSYYNLLEYGLHYAYPLSLFYSPNQLLEPVDDMEFDFGLGIFKNGTMISTPVYYNTTTMNLPFGSYFTGVEDGWYGMTLYVYVDEAISDGDYQIFPISREKGASEWQKDQGYNEHYFNLNISGETATVTLGTPFDISAPITPDPVTVTADNLTMTYGDPVPTLTYSSSGSALKGTPSLTTTATSTSDVGTYPIIVSQGSVYNSSFTGVNGTLTILPAPATCTINDASKALSDPMPAFTFTYSGWRNGDDESVLTTTPTAACYHPDVDTYPGTYPIVFSQDPVAKNYTFSTVTGTLTVTPDLISYPIVVAGTQVNETNCGDVLGDGKVSYDPSTYTLTFNNANLVSSTTYGLQILETNLVTILLRGSTLISSSLTDALNTSCSLSIQSEPGNRGGLVLQSSASSGLVFDGELIIGDCDLSADGAAYGIAGSDFPANALNITIEEGAVVTVGGLDGAIVGFDTFTMPSDYELSGSEECQVAAKNSNYSICTTNGDIYKGTLTIQKVSTVDYGLSICGVPVTSDNCTAVTDANIDGTVSFDPATQTLTLQDVTLNYTGDKGNTIERPAAYSTVPLTINLVGFVSAESKDAKMEFHSPTTFTGAGRFYGMNVDAYADLTIANSDRFYTLAVNAKADDVTVTVQNNPATNSQFTADPSLSNVKLVIDASEVLTSSITGFTAVEMKGGSEMLFPREARYDEVNKTLFYSLNPSFSGNYRIGIFEAEDYGLTVGEVAVTSKNASNITGDKITGSVSFDPASWTLTLDGATITDSRANHAAIERVAFGYEQFATSPLSIVLKGENTLDGHSVIICKESDAFFSGDGTLVCGVGTYDWEYFTAGYVSMTDIKLSTSGKGLYFNATQTQMQSATVEANGIGGTGTLTIDNSDITSTGKISQFDDVVVQNAQYQTPEGASYDTTKKSVVTADGTVASKVVIVSDATAIVGVNAPLAADAMIYSLDGRRIHSLQRGVNIVRMSDGTVKKVYVK